MEDESGGDKATDPAAAADYIAELAANLAALARQHRFEVLSFILDMARLEAEHTRRQIGKLN